MHFFGRHQHENKTSKEAICGPYINASNTNVSPIAK